MDGTANDLDEAPPGEATTTAGHDAAPSTAATTAATTATATASPVAERPGAPREDRLFLADDLNLRAGLVAAFARILARAAGQLERVDTEPARAVHEFRKSVRRARALLALMRPSLRTRDYREIATGLRSAHRATSGLRDSDVLLATLDSLRKTARGDAELERAAEQWRGHLARHSKQSRPPGEAASVLRGAAAELPRLSEHFDRALPTRTSWKDVARGLRRTLRRGQKARSRAVGAGEDEALHDWRKRVKELNYQLEILTRGSTIGPVTVRKQFADLAEALGEITDRLVLREALEQTAGAAPTSSGSEMADAPATGDASDDDIQAAARLAAFAAGDVESRRTALIAQSDELMTKPCRQFVDLLVAEARSARRRLVSRPAP